MSIELAKEMWSELRRYVNTVDREEAADVVVSLLIDNDYSAEDIKDTFRNDSDIKRALQSYLGDEEEEFEEDEEEDEDYDEDY